MRKLLAKTSILAVLTIMVMTVTAFAAPAPTIVPIAGYIIFPVPT